MSRGIERSVGRRVMHNGCLAVGAAAAGAATTLLVHPTPPAETSAAADTSQFIPPNCDKMPNPHRWEHPLCQKMVVIGRNVLAAYNDGDVRDNAAYAWKLTQQPDGFSLDVSGELPGRYSARYHRLSTGVQLVEVQQTVQVTDGLQERFNLEIEPVTASPESQLHFFVTRPGNSASDVPIFLFDSHTQASDIGSADAMAARVTPIVAQNGAIAVQ